MEGNLGDFEKKKSAGTSIYGNNADADELSWSETKSRSSTEKASAWKTVAMAGLRGWRAIPRQSKVYRVGTWCESQSPFQS